MNLEVQNEAAKKVFVKSGNLNWASLSLPEQDKAMFEILILVACTASREQERVDRKSIPKHAKEKTPKLFRG